MRVHGTWWISRPSPLREEVTRHDVKARIEEFCALAGHEHIHKGMTSRDLTENVEQLQVFRALGLVRLKAVACLDKLAARAREAGCDARGAHAQCCRAAHYGGEALGNVWRGVFARSCAP
ncbi:MAG: hypothetical protein LBD01_05915 [Puniceicoccales bacterium]|nr:hypothetical protein [Puniceicoccales bacterium]